MSTTRHLINRQRRLAAAAATTVAPRPVRPAAPARDTARDTARDRAREAAADRPAAPSRRFRPPTAVTLATAALALLTVLLGGFAAWAAGKASALHGSAATGNTALTDTARTSEVKGAVTQAVNALFSYDYADTTRTDKAAARVLTGRAVQQYATMIAEVRAQGPARKLVLTTTVTDTGVEMIDGDRARVLVFADQRDTSTASTAGTAGAGKAGTTYAAAMFAVDAVRHGGTWRLAAIDTFG
jgi:Mce-associated membrane protein